MQKTPQNASAELVINNAWETIKRLRYAVNDIASSDAFIPIMTLLYGYHKGYELLSDDKAGQLFVRRYEDELLNDLLRYCHVPSKAFNYEISNFAGTLPDLIDRDTFNAVYADVLKGLFNIVSVHANRAEGMLLTPDEIIKLMAYFIDKEECHSVYDPFCGTASIAKELSKFGGKMSFKGEELSFKLALYARVLTEAVYGKDDCILCGNSITEWSSQHYDAVVTYPPFGYRLSQYQKDYIEAGVETFKCRTVEEIVLTRPFSVNSSTMTVTLLPLSFCFLKSFLGIRKYLIDLNLIDLVVVIPANIFYGTSIACVVLVCKKGRSETDSVTIVRAQDYVLGENRDRTFDVERFITMFEGNRQDCLSVKRDDIIEFDYNLAPELYDQSLSELKVGQQIVRLGDLIKPASMERIDFTFEIAASVKSLSDDFITILHNKDNITDSVQKKDGRIYRVIKPKGKPFLLTSTLPLSSLKYGLYTKEEALVCPSHFRAFQINDSVILPEYLAYILANNKVITNGYMPLENYLKLSIIIDEKDIQHEIVDRQIQQHVEHVRAEQEADAKRLGVKQNLSDLEHMLGPTQLKINKIISRMEKLTPDSERLTILVKSLKDNVGYMNRIIHYTNAPIDSETFNMKSCDIYNFVEGYANSWRNYGGPYFDLQLCNEMDGTVMVNCDTTMLTVMFDSILSNAARHGFRKNKNHTAHNELQVTLSLVEYKERPFVCLSFANNGDPIADGFTIRDYISKGRYSAKTGRSGLGGYHVYRIAKEHGGYIYLDTNKRWNVVVDVLLPTCSTSIQTYQTYEHECI